MDSIMVSQGVRPILISASHGSLHLRNSNEQILRQAEINTLNIAKALSDKIGGFFIGANSQLDYDPNFDPKSRNTYKKTVEQIIKENKIKYFIDIHGLSDRYLYDFGFYFERSFRNSRKLAVTISNGIVSKELRGSISQILYFPIGFGESVSSFVCKNFKIPAIQIEVARYIREDEILTESFVGVVSQSIKGLIEKL